MIKPSEYFPDFWLVYFYTETQFYYVTDSAVKAANSTTTTHIIGPSNVNSISLESTKPDTAKEREQIMTQILHSKIHATYPNHLNDDLSVCAIVDLFKPKYTWMTTNKLEKISSKIMST